MEQRKFQLIIEYDGAEFSGWQRQPASLTIQGELERVFSRLAGAPAEEPVVVTGAGRTDSGVHARGQSAHVDMPARWNTADLRRAANSLLPREIHISRIFEVRDEFHARFSALSRKYCYQLGTTEKSLSPFRCKYEWYVRNRLDTGEMRKCSDALIGRHRFLGFAVQGTAPQWDTHHSDVTLAMWEEKEDLLLFNIEASRFLHHMVRFLVGTMVEVGLGRRDYQSFIDLLNAADNKQVSPPAPPHGLFLDGVIYPPELYISGL